MALCLKECRIRNDTIAIVMDKIQSREVRAVELAKKYVLKYKVQLPQEFIDHVMSDAGKAYIENFYRHPDSWSETITAWKNQENGMCLLPDDAGNRELDDF